MGDGEEGKRGEGIKQEEYKDLYYTISSNRDVL